MTATEPSPGGAALPHHTEWALASILAAGPTLVAALVLLLLDVHLVVHERALWPFNRFEARLAALGLMVGSAALFALSIVSVVAAFRAIAFARRHRQPAGLAVGGLACSLVAVLLQLIAFVASIYVAVDLW
jgi:hypothetical protein